MCQKWHCEPAGIVPAGFLVYRICSDCDDAPIFQAFEDNDEYDDSYGGVEDTFEWLIIAENYTALPYEIWLDCVGCDRGSESIPEIRVHIKEQELLVPVSIGEEPTVLMEKQFEHSELVLDWVKKNSEKLLRIWNHDYPDLEEDEAKMSFIRHV